MNDCVSEELRSMIEDLQETLSISNHRWNAWQLEFIESMAEKLECSMVIVSAKQTEKIRELWDMI